MALVHVICEKLRLTSGKPTINNLSGFLDERFSDVTVNVSHLDNAICSYKLHRNVLAGCSPVFFQSLVNSHTNDTHQTLDITFMSPIEFELLITFMYTGDIYFESVSELCLGLYAANLYRMDNLQHACTEKLEKKLEDDCGNCLLILQLDERFNSRADNLLLFEHVDSLIKADYQKMFASRVIEDLEMNMLKYLLQKDSISKVPEIDVYRALLRWTNAQRNASGNEKVIENLQNLAEDLTYHIRYNLIPRIIVNCYNGKLEVPQHLLMSEAVGKHKEVIRLAVTSPEKEDLKLTRGNKNNENKKSAASSQEEKETASGLEFKVPFCTQWRELIEDNGASDQEIIRFESKCTIENHDDNQVSRWCTVDTLSWIGNYGSIYFPLTAITATNTRWKVQLWRVPNDDFAIVVHCLSLDAKFCAASIRLFAVVEGHPQVWTEVASVLKSGEESWGGWFSRKMSELENVIPLKVRVRARWTELNQVTFNADLWNSDATHIRCHWQLNNWRAVNPTSEWWRLFSEIFGHRGALWRIFLESRRIGTDRQLFVGLVLQHLPASINWSRMSWNCSLSLCNWKFAEQKADMRQDSCCGWTAIVDVMKYQNPLDLNVVIHVSRKNRT